MEVFHPDNGRAAALVVGEIRGRRRRREGDGRRRGECD